MAETAIYIVLNEKLKQLDDWRTPNTVFMLGMMLGTQIDESCTGTAVKDASEITHAPIGNIVLPILSMKEEEMHEFYKRCKEREGNEEELQIFDFTNSAQTSHTYEEYIEKLSTKTLDEQLILGVAILGNKKPAKSLCGSLPRWK